MKSRVEELEDLVIELRENNEAMQESNKEMKEQLEAKGVAISKLKCNDKTLREDLTVEKAARQKETVELNQKIEELSQQGRINNEKNVALESKIKELNDQVRIANEKNAILENKISIINDTLKKHDLKFEWIGAKLTDFMSDISAIKSSTQIGLMDNKFTHEVIQTLAMKMDMMTEHIKPAK